MIFTIAPASIDAIAHITYPFRYMKRYGVSVDPLRFEAKIRALYHTMIENGITPVIFSEGSYTTRLKYFTELPPGKVIVHFEQVDIREAKRLLGDVCCIRGAYPTFTLTNGTKQQIIDKVKETFDVLAPGGGYLFTTGCAVDHCPRENLETLFEAVELYGKY